MAFIAAFEGIAAPEHVEVLKAAMVILEQESRVQPGTLRYEFHQSVTEPTRFRLCAVWEREEDWQAHVDSPAHRRFNAVIPEDAWIQRPVRTTWRRLDG